MRWMVTWVLVALTSAVSVSAGDEPELERLLERLAANAARYRTEALRFSCAEAIEWVGWGNAGRAKFGYVYVFDKDEGFEEYRTRYRKTPKKSRRRVEPENFGIPIYLNNAYLWCFTFRAERQPHHTYTLDGTETVRGIEAIRIRFEPIPPMIRHVNDWYGTAWIDPATAQLLKVEVVSPESQATLVALRTGAEITHDTVEVRRITTYFDERLEGLRVPSRVELRGEAYELESRAEDGWDYRKSIFHRVDQVYSDYRLFGVSTKERVGHAQESR